jgi:hypothetical protein
VNKKLLLLKLLPIAALAVGVLVAGLGWGGTHFVAYFGGMGWKPVHFCLY